MPEYLVESVLANYTTALGAALTEMTEINFTLPGDLRYGHSGMIRVSLPKMK